MRQFTPQGQNLINDLDRRRFPSHVPPVRMLVAVNQGGGPLFTFISQYGTVSTLSLPPVSGPRLQSENPTNVAAPPAPALQPAPFAPQPNPVSSDVVTLLEKLGQLRDAGILTPEKFAAKKIEWLNRL